MAEVLVSILIDLCLSGLVIRNAKLVDQICDPLKLVLLSFFLSAGLELSVEVNWLAFDRSVDFLPSLLRDQTRGEHGATLTTCEAAATHAFLSLLLP